MSSNRKGRRGRIVPGKNNHPCRFERLGNRELLSLTYTWTGGTTGYWSGPNWSVPGQSPAPSYPGTATADTAVLAPATGTQLGIALDVSPPIGLASMTASGGHTVLNLWDSTLISGTLAVGGPGDANGGQNTLDLYSLSPPTSPLFGQVAIGQGTGTSGVLNLHGNVHAVAATGAIVGGQGGTGTLNLTGASPSATAGLYTALLNIGTDAGSTGSVTVGMDSYLNVNGPLLVGTGGKRGSLTVFGTPQTSSPLVSTSAVVGQTGSADVTLSSWTVMPNGDSLKPGDDGSLVVNAGGTIKAVGATIQSQSATIGAGATSASMPSSVDLSGSEWSVGTVGPFAPTAAAGPALQIEDGSLTIHDGSGVDAVSALVTADVNAFSLGEFGGPTPGFISVTPGSSTVPPGGSSVSTFSTTFGLTLGVAVADAAQAATQTGSLLVGGGADATGRKATVVTSTSTNNFLYAPATINGGSHATVTQNGSWTTNGSLVVGDQYNAGFLAIDSKGGVYTKGNASVDGVKAVATQAIPNVNITGDSQWNVLGSLNVAADRNSNPSIAISSSGPLVSGLWVDGPADIGDGSGSKPAITVGSDAELGTSMTNSGPTSLGAGQGSSASVVVQDGGNWTVGNDSPPNPTLQSLSIGRADDGSNASYLGVYGTGAVWAGTVNVNSGAIKGTGTVYAEVNDVGGAILPGDTPTGAGTGKLTINGDLTDQSSSTLGIDIGGTAQGAATDGYDLLYVTGFAILNGTLKISLLNGFCPQPNQEFTILEADGGRANRSEFSNVIGWKLGGGLTWEVLYTNQEVVLLAFNAQGVPVPGIKRGASFTNAPVATLAGISSDEFSQLTAVVRWGDKTQSGLPTPPLTIDNTSATTQNGSITFDGTTATVQGTYDYLTLGNFSVLTTLFIGGQELCTVDSLATVVASTLSLSVTSNPQFIRGQADNLVATLTDAGGAEQDSNYAATIDWGDNNTTPADVAGNYGNQFYVYAGDRHAYTTTGGYWVTVTVTDADGATASAQQYVNVVAGAPLYDQDAPPLAMPSNGTLDNVVVASFVDSGGAEDASHYSADIAITGNNGLTAGETVQPVYDAAENEFDVLCSCQLPDSNADSINVTITEDGVQGLVFKNGFEESSIYNYVYAPASPPSQLYLTALDGAHIGNNGSLVEAQPFTSLTLASFAVSDPSVAASSFSANVDNWGDGQGSTASIVSDGEGGFLVQGSHTYAEAGQYSIPIEIFYTPLGGPVGPLCSLHATATVSDAALEDPAWAASLNPVANAPLSDPPLSPVTLATFTVPNPNAADSYFAAIITWQPGHQTSGTVAQVPGTDQYTVSGSYSS